MRSLFNSKFFYCANNRQGNSVLVVLSLMVVTFSVFQIGVLNNSNSIDSVKGNRVLNARDFLASNIETYVNLGSSLRSSMHPSLPAQVNQELKNCIFGTGPSPCQGGSVETPFFLYYPISSTEPTVSTDLKIISGPADQPAYYDDKGHLCDPTASESCHFMQISTTFIANCAGGAATCTTADSITVHYVIKKVADTSNQIVLSKIDRYSSPIDRANILPSTALASASNVMVKLFGDTSSASPATYDQIVAALKAIGYSDPSQLQAIAQTFLNAGFTNLSIISSMAASTFDKIDVPTFIEAISLVAQTVGVSDIKMTTLLVSMGITDVNWFNVVIASGITSAFYAKEFYWTNLPQDPATLKAVVAALNAAGMPEDTLSVAIGARPSTDVASVQAIYSKVSSLSSRAVAAGVVSAQIENDTALVNNIMTALVDIQEPVVQEAMAYMEITSYSLAEQMEQAVSTIANPWDAAGLIYDSNGNLNTLLQLVAGYSPPGSTVTTVSSTSTSGTGGSSSTSSTNITYVETCTSCSGFSY